MVAHTCIRSTRERCIAGGASEKMALALLSVGGRLGPVSGALIERPRHLPSGIHDATAQTACSSGCEGTVVKGGATYRFAPPIMMGGYGGLHVSARTLSPAAQMVTHHIRRCFTLTLYKSLRTDVIA